MRCHILLSILACLLIASCLALAEDKKISKKEVPVAVLTAFKKACPHAKILGLSKEVEEGKIFYEIESMDGTKRRDLLYTADGTVAEIEETVAASELPEAVKVAVQNEYPEGKIAKAEKLTRGSMEGYEIHIVSGKKKHELLIDPRGKILKWDKEKGERKNPEQKK